MHKLFQLKNNLNVITVPIKGTKAITVMALFPIGSRYENAKLSGVSHFVEHMMFKGTSKRPNALSIARLLEAQGANYNAFTGKDYTGYYIKINSVKSEIAFDLLSDMIFNSKFEAEEVERERGVIVEELRMYDDNPIMAIENLFEQTIYGMNNSLGRDIGGTTQTVCNVSRKELFNYYNKYYTPNNVVLIVAGNLPIKKKLNEFLEYFINNHNVKSSKINLVNNYKKFTWPKKVSLDKRVSVKTKKLDQAHLILGFPGLKHNDPQKYAMSIMLNILGIGMNSRLFTEIRERRGLAYMVRADWSHYRDVGSVQIQAGLDPARLSQAIGVILDQLHKMANEPISVQELREAKSSFIGRMTLANEDSSIIADWFAKQFWFSNKIKNREEVCKELRAVSIEDVQKITKQLFKMDQLRLAVIGNIKKDKVLKMIKI